MDQPLPVAEKPSFSRSRFSFKSFHSRPRRITAQSKNTEGNERTCHQCSALHPLYRNRQAKEVYLETGKGVTCFWGTISQDRIPISCCRNYTWCIRRWVKYQLVWQPPVTSCRLDFVHLPNIIIVSMRYSESGSTRTHFVRATGRVALTSLHKVHQIYRDVLHDGMTSREGSDALRELLRSPPIYPLYVRCVFAFICASIICVLSFGGSILDMWISGICAGALQYLGLNAASKSSMYANVYE